MGLHQFVLTRYPFPFILDNPPALSEDAERGSNLRPGEYLRGWGASARGSGKKPSVLRSILRCPHTAQVLLCQRKH